MQRSQPFSGKKKKEQLKLNRAKKKVLDENEDTDDITDLSKTVEATKISNPRSGNLADGDVPSAGRPKSTNANANRLRTVFDLETKEEIEQRKRASHQPLTLELRQQPWRINETLTGDFIDIPKRPPLTGHDDKSTQERREEECFRDWQAKLKQYPPERLNYFERNLEVWRQLWRVCERSDIIVIVMDTRFPLFHFPPALYRYVVTELKRPVLLVLNKCDTVDPFVLGLWKQWFTANYPHLRVISFASFRSSDDTSFQIDKKRKLKRGKKDYRAAEGVNAFLRAIQEFKILKNGQVVNLPLLPLRNEDASPGERPSSSESDAEDTSDDDTDNDEDVIEEDRENLKYSDSKESRVDADANGSRPPFIVVGTVGHPNVGKSSLINALMGRKVVSTSRTPGHTKHFQTIFLTPEVQLCDCPGLVFPALDRPKALQILCGLYPLAQVREPYSAVRYLAERVPLEQVYGLKLPEDEQYWSPSSLCEALAIKRGYLLAKSGRPDAHRAGREILIDALDGRIVISWPPPDSQHQMELHFQSLQKVVASEPNDTHTNTDAVPEHERKDKKAKKKQQKQLRRQQLFDRGEDLYTKSKQQTPSDLAEETASTTATRRDTKADKAREYQERLAAKSQRNKRRDDSD